jgi:hypothetical protein
MLFENLERKALELIRAKFQIKTNIIDTDDELSLEVTSLFDDKVVHSHKQDLMPLYEAFKKRIDHE